MPRGTHLLQAMFKHMLLLKQRPERAPFHFGRRYL